MHFLLFIFGIKRYQQCTINPNLIKGKENQLSAKNVIGLKYRPAKQDFVDIPIGSVF
jgi:hypothetical protein